MIRPFFNKTKSLSAGLGLVFAFTVAATGQSHDIQAADPAKKAVTGQQVSVTEVAAVVTPNNSVVAAAETEPSKTAVEKALTLSKLLSVAPVTKDVAETAPKAPPKQAATSSGWQFELSPYVNLTGLNGTIGARGRTVVIDQSIGDILSHLKFGLMGAFTAKKGRAIIFNDFFWAKLSEEGEVPTRLYGVADVTIKMVIDTAGGGYRVAEGKAGSFDILGGVRIMSVKNELDVASGILPGFYAEQRKTWAAPVIGGHGVYNITPKVFLSTLFDIGGGFGTHLTGQVYGGGGYNFTPKAAIIGGWRYLRNDYSDDAGFIFDTSMNGFVIGGKFRF